jgi:hypothetical protein
MTETQVMTMVAFLNFDHVIIDPFMFDALLHMHVPGRWALIHTQEVAHDDVHRHQRSSARDMVF